MTKAQLHHIKRVEESLAPQLHWLKAIQMAQACLINLRTFTKDERKEINVYLNNHYTVVNNDTSANT